MGSTCEIAATKQQGAETIDLIEINDHPLTVRGRPLTGVSGADHDMSWQLDSAGSDKLSQQTMFGICDQFEDDDVVTLSTAWTICAG